MKSTLINLKPERLIIDPSIQRDLVASQMNTMIGDKYDPESLGILIVSHRANGTYVILDGQHRWNVVKLCDPDRELVCLVYEELSTQQEAELFLSYNNQSSVNQIARFRAAVMANRTLPLAVMSIFDKYGLKVGTGQQEIAAVADCMRVALWSDGLTLLDGSLNILTGAWGLIHNPVRGEGASETIDLPRTRGNRPYRGTIIAGMARVIHHYGNQLKPDKMIAQLVEMGSRGPEEIARDVDSLRSVTTRVSADEAAASVLVRAYNNRTGGGKLPRWPLDQKSEDTSVSKRKKFTDMVSEPIPVSDDEEAALGLHGERDANYRRA